MLYGEVSAMAYTARFGYCPTCDILSTCSLFSFIYLLIYSDMSLFSKFRFLYDMQSLILSCEFFVARGVTSRDINKIRTDRVTLRFRMET